MRPTEIVIPSEIPAEQINLVERSKEWAKQKAKAEFEGTLRALDPELVQLNVTLTLAKLALREANLKLPSAKRKVAQKVKTPTAPKEVKNDSTPPV
jgi:hypothetical protein